MTFTTVGPADRRRAPAQRRRSLRRLEGALIDTCGAPTTVWIYWGASDGGESPDGGNCPIRFGRKRPGPSRRRLRSGQNTAYFYRVYAENT